jgi:hypothetical protein
VPHVGDSALIMPQIATRSEQPGPKCNAIWPKMRQPYEKSADTMYTSFHFLSPAYKSLHRNPARAPKFREFRRFTRTKT